MTQPHSLQRYDLRVGRGGKEDILWSFSAFWLALDFPLTSSVSTILPAPYSLFLWLLLLFCRYTACFSFFCPPTLYETPTALTCFLLCFSQHPFSYGTCCYWSGHLQQTATTQTQNPGCPVGAWEVSVTWEGLEVDRLEGQSQRALGDPWEVH